MESVASRTKTVVTWAAVYVLCAGFVLFGTGCPVTPTPQGCSADADCDDGAYCNGTETCVNAACQAGTNPCTTGQTCDETANACVTEGCQTDDDCAEGEFCDTGTNECVTNENLYDTTKVDADYAERVHSQPSGHTNCTVCHHAADEAAGVPDAAGQGCTTCHSEDPNVANSFKSVAHDEDESGDGCRMCHAAEFTDNCGFCHPLVEDL